MKITSSTYFYTAIVAFGVGVLIQSFTFLGVSFILFLLGLGVVLGVVFYVRRSRVTIFVAIAIIAVGLGVGRFSLSQAKPPEELENAVGGEVVLTGTVIREPIGKERTQQLVVRLEENKVHILLITSPRPSYSYGDVLDITGKLVRPEGFVTDSGRVFDYASYLAKDDIYYELLFPGIERVGSGGGSAVKRTLFSFKNAFLHNVREVIPEPHAALLGGLVVGTQEALGDDLLDAFRVVGLIHIVVLSGYNIAIVAEAMMRGVGRLLPRYGALALGAIGIVLFAIMTGASATIVRASIMALLVVVARGFGREYNVTRALALAGFLMVLHNPRVLAFDPSFQLSFLATVGLIYLGPFIERVLHWVPTKFQFREFAVATISTQLFVLPLLLFMVGQISTLSIPVNILVLGIIPLIMLFGFITGMLGFLGNIVSLPFAYITTALLAYVLWVVRFFSAIPFASLKVPTFPVWAVVVVYALLVCWLIFLKRKTTVSTDAVVSR